MFSWSNNNNNVVVIFLNVLDGDMDFELARNLVSGGLGVMVHFSVESYESQWSVA